MAIVAKSLQHHLGQPSTHVIRGIDLEVPLGDFVALTGKSGSGKSTLLYLLSTLDRPTSGEVWIKGRNVRDFSVREVHEFRNRHMGFVFQFHHLIPELTALENVLMPALKFRLDRREAASRLLKEFGLEGKFDRLPGQLSGGEQQRVAIARALVMEPDFLFADEPTGNLDSANSAIVMRIFERINRERKTTIIFVTHDADLAAMAKRTVHLTDGRVSSPSGA